MESEKDTERKDVIGGLTNFQINCLSFFLITCEKILDSPSTYLSSRKYTKIMIYTGLYLGS